MHNQLSNLNSTFKAKKYSNTFGKIKEIKEKFYLSKCKCHTEGLVLYNNRNKIIIS